MSVPYHIITCDNCDYRQHSLVGTGWHLWRKGSAEFSFRRQLGICAQCCGLVAMERFPPEAVFVEARRCRRNRLRRLLRWFGGDEAGKLASEAGFEVLEAIMDMKRPPVCLTCGQARATPLDSVLLINPADRTVRRLGILHPGCGGMLMAQGSGANRIAMLEMVRVYDVSGRIISERYGSPSVV